VQHSSPKKICGDRGEKEESDKVRKSKVMREVLRKVSPISEEIALLKDDIVKVKEESKEIKAKLKALEEK